MLNINVIFDNLYKRRLNIHSDLFAGHEKDIVHSTRSKEVIIPRLNNAIGSISRLKPHFTSLVCKER